MKSLATTIGSSGRSLAPDDIDNDDNETSKMAIASYQAREEEIERKKMEVRRRVESQLMRAEEKTRRLAQVWEEIQVLTDPTRKEMFAVRKRIDIVSREVKTLAQICQKKEKEYKEVFQAFHEKNKEKAQLTTTLVELVNQSEDFRLRKLEELSKIVNSKT